MTHIDGCADQDCSVCDEGQRSGAYSPKWLERLYGKWFSEGVSLL